MPQIPHLLEKQKPFSGCSDCREYKAKMMEMEDTLKERDARFRQRLGQVNVQLTAAKKENLELKNAHHRLKIKYATSTIGHMLRGRRSQSNPSLAERDSIKSGITGRERYIYIQKILTSLNILLTFVQKTY